ncbi:g10584 [Coccomyxa elongata]
MAQPAGKSPDASVNKNLDSQDSSLSTNSLETDAAPGQHRQRLPPDHTVHMPDVPYNELPDEHQHFSQRAPWLRAGVLGANDGLVSVASLMLGVEGGTNELHPVVLAGVAGLVAGALSMAVGEFVSVSSQRDAEEADIEKERKEQAKGPAARQHELEELTAIYEERGLSYGLARQVAEELTAKDVIRAHARDELGIDIDDMTNPYQAAASSAFAFIIGAGLPLLAGAFIEDANWRIVSVVLTSAAALAAFGILGAVLGGAGVIKGGSRVLLGGLAAMAITYGFGRAFNRGGPAPP